MKKKQDLVHKTSYINWNKETPFFLSQNTLTVTNKDAHLMEIKWSVLYITFAAVIIANDSSELLDSFKGLHCNLIQLKMMFYWIAIFIIIVQYYPNATCDMCKSEPENRNIENNNVKVYI